jgi:hypothetical protein
MYSIDGKLFRRPAAEILLGFRVAAMEHSKVWHVCDGVESVVRYQNETSQIMKSASSRCRIRHSQMPRSASGRMPKSAFSNAELFIVQMPVVAFKNGTVGIPRDDDRGI